MQETGIQSKI